MVNLIVGLVNRGNVAKCGGTDLPGRGQADEGKPTLVSTPSRKVRTRPHWIPGVDHTQPPEPRSPGQFPESETRIPNPYSSEPV
jgi:hypothetical protein